MKRKPTKAAAQRTSSPDTLAMLLRGGAGKHGDRRTKRQRDRGAAKRAAINAAH